jgi:hypothetical protein
MDCLLLNQEETKMENESRRKNREVVSTIGDLVTVLYDELEVLPFSVEAKQALVMIMVGDIMRREGCTVSFFLPPRVGNVVAA